MNFKKRYLFAGIFAFLVIIGLFSKKTAPAKAETEQTAEYSLTAAGLLQEYRANEVAADQRYKGRLVLVTGIVEAVKKDFTGAVTVDLEAGGTFRSVRCYSDEEAAAAKLVRGQKITVKGVVQGYTAGTPTVRDSRFFAL